MKDEKEDLEGEAEEIDLDDMTDDDLKKFIEDVIEDMVAAGEIEAGDNFEDNVDVTVDDDGSIDVEVEDEVMESKEVNESEGVNEVVGTAMAGAAALVAAAGGLAKISNGYGRRSTRICKKVSSNKYCYVFHARSWRRSWIKQCEEKLKKTCHQMKNYQNLKMQWRNYSKLNHLTWKTT